MSAPAFCFQLDTKTHIEQLQISCTHACTHTGQATLTHKRQENHSLFMPLLSPCRSLAASTQVIEERAAAVRQREKNVSVYQGEQEGDAPARLKGRIRLCAPMRTSRLQTFTRRCCRRASQDYTPSSSTYKAISSPVVTNKLPGG